MYCAQGSFSNYLLTWETLKNIDLTVKNPIHVKMSKYAIWKHIRL